MLKTQLLLIMTMTFGLTGTTIRHTHLMSTLLCIESMTLTLFMGLSLTSLNDPNFDSSPILVLTIGACEASCGLALLTATSHKNNNDHTKNLNLLRC